VIVPGASIVDDGVDVEQERAKVVSISSRTMTANLFSIGSSLVFEAELEN
jgi:hypothetical protein